MKFIVKPTKKEELGFCISCPTNNTNNCATNCTGLCFINNIDIGCIANNIGGAQK